MPVYEYNCKQNSCGSYEVWRSIDTRVVDTHCPSCGGEGQRIFTAPMTLTGSLRLKVESKEPRLAKKKEITRQEPSPRLKESSTRPWMLNRGC